ncbi:MAG: hypothetical protein COC06_07655 [Bacteroidales bacterium]|nr:MAG: hypothetical protein COC06_07655 [Bacteroidales bacterium]
MTKEEFVARLNIRCRRADIIDALRRGDQKKLAKKCNCAASTVSAVLNGHADQSSTLAIKIIRCAEQKAETNKKVRI